MFAEFGKNTSQFLSVSVSEVKICLMEFNIILLGLIVLGKNQRRTRTSQLRWLSTSPMKKYDADYHYLNFTMTFIIKKTRLKLHEAQRSYSWPISNFKRKNYAKYAKEKMH